MSLRPALGDIVRRVAKILPFYVYLLDTMPRKNKGGRRGAANWAKGTQLVFLESRKPEWLAAAVSRKSRSKFYGDMAILFVKKYGWDMVDNGDPDPDESDIAALRGGLLDGDTAEANKAQVARLTALRAVSHAYLSVLQLVLMHVITEIRQLLPL